MSQTYVAAPRVRARFRIVLAAVVAAAAIAALIAGRSTSSLPTPIGPKQLVCEELEPPTPVPPPKPTPTADSYAALAACLKIWHADNRTGSIGPSMREADVTVEKVRHWVEVDGDPAWFDGGTWWFPLSGEGSAEMPSGVYGIVPGCGMAIVN